MAFVMSSALAGRADRVNGPVEVTVVKVLDGDTFVADAKIWPNQSVRVKVRIRGIDAPENRAKCASERNAAKSAERLLADLLHRKPVQITNIGGGKYYGRVLADVHTDTVRSIAALMLSRGAVRPYRGGKRYSHCKANRDRK